MVKVGYFCPRKGMQVGGEAIALRDEEENIRSKRQTTQPMGRRGRAVSWLVELQLSPLYFTIVVTLIKCQVRLTSISDIYQGGKRGFLILLVNKLLVKTLRYTCTTNTK